MSKKFNRYGQSQKKMNFAELFDRYYYVPIIAVALVAAIIIGVMVYNHFQENAYQKQLILGDKYLEEGKYKESILAFDSAIHIKDKNPAAYRRKATVYGRCGDNKALTRLVKTYPTYFINYSLTKNSKSSSNQNYTISQTDTFPFNTLLKKSDFEDSVVALSTDSKGKNNYTVDMDLIGANTLGGTIYYTTDGTKPTDKSKVFQKPINVTVKDNEHPVTVKAIAKNEKNEQTKVYDTTLAYSDIKAPSIDTKKDEKNEGKYNISMKCDEKNAEIYYTKDGKEPTKKSEQYKKPFTVDVKEGQTASIKAITYVKDDSSGIVTSTIVSDEKKENESASKDKNADKQTKEKQTALNNVFVVMPIIVISEDSKDAGTYNVNIITTNDGNKIYYTTDGKDPTVKSAAYKNAFTVKAHTGKTITIKAIAVDKDGNVSDIAKQEETPVVVNIPKKTEEKESENKDSADKEKQTKTTKDDSSKKDDTKSDAKNSDSKSGDTTTTKDKTAQTDSNKDTGLKDNSLPTVPKETAGKETDVSGSESGNTKNDSNKTNSDSSDTTSDPTIDSSDTTADSKSDSGTTADQKTDNNNSNSTTKSNSGSSANKPAPSVSAAPAVNLTAPILSKSTSQTGSGVTIEWKPVASADGYEYYYENGTYVDNKEITTTTYQAVKNKEGKSNSFTLKVRAYHTQNGKKIYSDWSTLFEGNFEK